MRSLTSAKNPTLQSIRAAIREGRATGEGFWVLEGPHLIKEALKSAWPIRQIFVRSQDFEKYEAMIAQSQLETTALSSRAFDSLSGTETTQGIMALVQPRTYDWKNLLAQSALVLVLDAIQDPGNAGTLFRSAEAFGATGLILLRGCARLTNGKLLRASAGSVFRVPFLENIRSEELVRQCQSASVALFALTTRAALDLRQAGLVERCALAIGNEGAGVSPLLISAATGLKISTNAVESLNAAVAGSIALFEAARQRGVV
jgi:TrmH family RNA methyltransferase